MLAAILKGLLFAYVLAVGAMFLVAAIGMYGWLTP